jgi:predicted transcriptional regulator of viral defense system
MRVYAYNDRISGDRTIGAVALTLIKVNAKRLGDVEALRGVDGPALVYSSRARTLVDAVYDWSRFNSLPHAYTWILDDLVTGRVDPARLVRTALRFGDLGTRRRLGVLLERAGTPESTLARLERSLTPSSSLIPWIPSRPKRGTVSRRWGVLVNGEIGEWGDSDPG